MTRAGESNLIFESLHQIEGHLREDRMFFIEILNLRFAWLKSLKTESQMMRVKVIPLGQESGDQRIVKLWRKLTWIIKFVDQTDGLAFVYIGIPNAIPLRERGLFNR